MVRALPHVLAAVPMLHMLVTPVAPVSYLFVALAYAPTCVQEEEAEGTRLLDLMSENGDDVVEAVSTPVSLCVSVCFLRDLCSLGVFHASFVPAVPRAFSGVTRLHA